MSRGGSAHERHRNSADTEESGFIHLADYISDEKPYAPHRPEAHSTGRTNCDPLKKPEKYNSQLFGLQ
jgi:hypothetical protein